MTEPQPERPLPIGQLSGSERQELLLLLTTEHFTVQTARSATITESTGRTTAFLSILAGAVVALALLAQIEISDHALRLLAAGGLAVVLLIGLATYRRLVQLAAQDRVYRIATNRIRRAYLDLRPEAAPYLTLPGHDDATATTASHDVGRDGIGWWDLFLSSAAVIALIDAVLAAAVALLLTIDLTGSAGLAAALGLLLFAALLLAQLTALARSFVAVVRTHPPRFPGRRA